MKNIVLDFAIVTNKDELHAMLKERLMLPAYYGENIDALGDMLSGWIKTPVRIQMVGSRQLRNNLGEYGDRLLEVFEQASRDVDGIEIELLECVVAGGSRSMIVPSRL